ncbi:hypothetical protein GCM10020331_101600 [Ectobacillus funiculus]
MLEMSKQTPVNTSVMIPPKMKAVVAYAPGDYKFEEVDTPNISDEEILIKVEACGVCAGDCKAHGGAPSFWGDETQPAYIKAPMIPGHEFIGYVVALGEKKYRDLNSGIESFQNKLFLVGNAVFL